MPNVEPNLRSLRSGFFMAGAVLLLASACGGKPSGVNNNNQIWCEGDEQCPAGMVCEGNSCIWPSDSGQPDADVRSPDIALSAQQLDFQSPLLGTEVVLPLTIHNVGQADLRITQIVIDEPGGLQEFHVSQEGAVQITIPPSGEHVLQVSLISVDAELDTGSLRIFSNDPDENPVVVTLTSEYKGTADLTACVFTEDATPPYPTHTYEDCQVDAQGRPVVDFQVVRYDQPEERIFVLWNVAQGNAPLAIEDILLSNTSGHANTYTISYFIQDPLTGDASPTSLPFFLSAGDPVNAIEPDLLYVSVLFDASVDVFPTEQLEIQTNDPDAGQLYVPIIGVLSGCPDDYWDVNHDPSDGCEYACVFQSTLEQCTPPGGTPADDNCDGEVDEEDAVGCSIFYRDHDGDTYGAIGDTRCLCGPEGEYTATVGLDCNDSDANVKPGVVERCITNYDDNCDGSDNDQNAQGCVNYLKDEDGDGYGVTGNSRCLCYAAGFYATTLGGDCDDNPAACGASCNPSKSENCSTVYDENCNGDNNELNALNCTNYYRDFDGDTYGHQTDSQCWCYPRNLYTALQPTDCNDADADINPGETEVCDLVDNNCAGGIDEGFNLQTNVNHCGACNHACTNLHGTTACVLGLCSPTCAAGYWSCDNNKDNGCETDLSTALFCGSCTNHPDCPTGFFCNVGTCTKKYVLGHTCSDDVMCQSTFCRDGVCCDKNCGGTTADCQSCNLAGSVGTCSFYPVSSNDPENACTFSAASTCGLNGNCDGAGTCAFYPSGTVCQSQTCSAGILYTQDTCDGFGTCQDSGTQSCGAYTCNDTGTGCRTSCTQLSHCATGNFCNASNQCVPTSPAGTPCTLDSQCALNMCRDGYCCNSDCSGSCRACNKAGSEGTCTYHASNTDPENDCSLCTVCNGNGSCVNVTASNDPLNECTASLPTSCGFTGDCSGSAACAYWPLGTVCAPQSCSGSTLNPADTCNGAGTCVVTAAAACANHLVCLDATNCRTSCTQDSHCVTGYYCASGSCQPKKSNGNTCGLGSECTSGNCVDGYCCNNTCSTTCMACNVATSLGTCTAVPNNTDPAAECGLCRVCNGSGACKTATSGTDPKEECAQDAASTCQNTGNCNGSGACALYASGTVCNPQTCPVGTGTKYYTDYCDGAGVCADGSSTSCEPYACGASNDCLTSCTGDTNCFTGYYCVSGDCCSPVTTNSGIACGTGTAYSATNNNTTPVVTDVTGNLVPTSAVRWYRFTTTEFSDDLNVWIYLYGNPGDEFRIEVWYNRYVGTTTPPGTPPGTETDCSDAVKATWDKLSSTNNLCGGEYSRYSWQHYGSPWVYTWNDSTTFYVKVYRSASATTPSCNSFTLRVQVGGSQPWPL